MPVLKLAPEELQRAYGIRCLRVLPTSELGAPVVMTHCVIAPGESTTPHQHAETETFYVASGRGTIEIEGEESRAVHAGDLMYLPAHRIHTLRNDSSQDELVFLSTYWEESGRAGRGLPARCLVTAAPPTPNGDLHLGHLSGPYVAADVHARYLRMRKVEAAYLCGSDDNQSYVHVKGLRMGERPEAIAERFGDACHASLQAAGVQVTSFLRPGRSPDYVRFVQQFFRRLVETGKLVRREAPSLHCERCGLYLYEAHVSGSCPHCEEPTNGNGCEACGLPNDSIDLGGPVCNHCNSPAVKRVFTRFYFPLGDYADRLERYFHSVIAPPRLAALVTEAIRAGLPDASASHVASWGIPVALDGFEGQVIYEWLEMAAGYLFSAAKLAPDGRWEHWWKDEGASVVQFFGIDNAFNYTTFLPALLLAYDPEIRLPAAFVTNEFYRLDGLKFSTSRNHAIWAPEALGAVSADSLRLYLSLDRPETEQTSFTLEGFHQTLSCELAGRWQTWLAEVDRRASRLEGVEARTRDRALSDDQLRFRERLVSLVAGIAECYSAAGFSSRRAARLLCELVDSAREFGRSQEFCLQAPGLRQAWETSLELELAAVRALALAAAPLMPGFSARLLAGLGLPSDLPWDSSCALVQLGDRPPRVALELFSDDLAGLEALIARRAAG